MQNSILSTNTTNLVLNHFLDPAKEKGTTFFDALAPIPNMRLICESALIDRELKRRNIRVDIDSLKKICELAHVIKPRTFVKLKRNTLIEDWDRERNEPFSMRFTIFMEARNQDVEVFFSLSKMIARTINSKIHCAVSILFKDISPQHVDMEVHSAIKQSSSLAASKNRIEIMEALRGCPYILETKSWGITDGNVEPKMQIFTRRLQGDAIDFFHEFDEKSIHPDIKYRNTIKVAYDMARAFMHMRSTSPGFVHKDVKPENVLFSWRLTDLGPIILHCKLADYEFAAPLNDEDRRTKAVGTLCYASPEMIWLLYSNNLSFERCSHFIDTEETFEDLITSKMDQWGLWCLLFLMKNGQLPECTQILLKLLELKDQRLEIKKSLEMVTNTESDKDLLEHQLIDTSKGKTELLREWEQSMIKLQNEVILLDWDSNFLDTLLWYLSRPNPKDRMNDNELLQAITEEAARKGVR